MALTVEAVSKELDEAQAKAGDRELDMEEVTACLSHGSLMGARGNSGVILSQVLRGMANAFRDAGSRPGGAGRLGPADLADAFSRASDSAYAAVSNPVEGTILTVARAAARGAEDVLRGAAPSDDEDEGPAWRTSWRLPAAPPPGRSPAQPSSCPLCGRPVWWTPEGRACCCCSTVSCRSWTAVRSRPRRRPPAESGQRRAGERRGGTPAQGGRRRRRAREGDRRPR